MTEGTEETEPTGTESDSSGMAAAVAAAGLRDLRDPRDMRALAHPTRLALLEALTLHGALTATQAAEYVGESPSSCSFHLRSLAKHQFVEETGAGRGRERPWRLVSAGTEMGYRFDDPKTQTAANALWRLFLERQFARLVDAQARRPSLPEEWAREQANLESIMWLTLDELREVNRVIFEIALRYYPRMTDPSLRPEGAEPLELLYFAYNVDQGAVTTAPDPDPEPEST